MTFDIIIPSHHRIRKLSECLASIARNFEKSIHVLNYVKVKVFFSDLTDIEEFKRLNLTQGWLIPGIFTEYRVPDFWNCNLMTLTADVMVCINDDIVFFDDSIEKIISIYEQQFPAADGVLGLNQVNIKDACDYSFIAIGIKFAERFPSRQVFCPDYERFFADQEIGCFARSIEKFVYSQEAKILHNHASFYPECVDETHYLVRTYWAGDHRTFQRRQSLGYLWGRDFNLINKERCLSEI